MCVDPLVIGSIIGSISLFMTVLFYNIRRSRCTHIQCGCLKCTRQMMTSDELKQDKYTLPQI